MQSNKTVITVEAIINAPIEKVWQFWTSPEHIVHWNFASDDWHCPTATNDLRIGGRFTSQMAARDGSFSFDFGGEYDAVTEHELIGYHIDGDARKVSVHFSKEGDTTRLAEHFEADETNAHELQKGGWQAILNNFKKHVEAN